MVWLFGQLNQRAVGQRIPPDHLGGVDLILILAVQRDLDLVRVFDDVIVRQDEAVPADDEPGARGHHRLLAGRPAIAAARRDLTPRAPRAARRLAEEAPEQIVGRPAAAAAEEVRQILRTLRRLGPDVDDDRRLRLRDVPECLRVEGPGDRRAVHRRRGEGLGRGSRRQIEPRGNDHSNRQRRHGNEQGVKQRSLAG
jgi:hypothetical protein